MQLNVLPNDRFTCQCCSKCCHHWHVALSDEEVRSIEALDWPDAHSDLRGIDFTQSIRGDRYLKHAADAGCVFLNRDTGLCRIHDAFGEDAKPLGCRVFPFHITATFDNQVTVTGRCDCPTVRANDGAAYSEHRKDILRYAKGMKLKGFSAAMMAGLSRDAIERITRFLADELLGIETNDERALFMHFFLNYIEEHRDRPPKSQQLKKASTAMRDLINATIDNYDEQPPSASAQLAFRSLLATYVRRDEDVVDGRASRLKRTLAVYRIVRGKGNFSDLGVNHVAGDLRHAELFTRGFELTDASDTELLWRVVTNRLRALQFMGRGALGADFYTGLRSLSLFYPLVIAAAKYNAAAAGRAKVGPDEIDLAVEAIEHSLGRSKLLASGISRRHESLLVQQYVSLVLGL